MTTYDIPSIPAAKLIGKCPPTKPDSQIVSHVCMFQSVSNAFSFILAFYLICIDTVWLVGALQDNKALFWLSIAVRGANAVLFASFGGKWMAFAGAATVTAGIMSAAMFFDSRMGRRGRMRKGRR